MKKKYIIGIIVILIILIVLGVISYKAIKKNERSYEIEKVNSYNYFVLKQQNSGYGVIDKQGNIIIDTIYQDVKIPNPEKAVFVCYTETNETKIFNEKREQILNEYHDVEAIRLKNLVSDLMYEKSVLKYEQDGKYGLIDFNGNQITKAVYEELGSLPYKEGELLVKQDGKYGVINIKGKSLVDIKYETIDVDGYYTDENKYEYAGYIVSLKTNEGYRYGYINYKGKQTIKEDYNELERVSEIKDNNNIYLLAAKNGQYGIIKNKDDLVSNEYQSIRYDASNEVFVVEKSKKYGIVNMEGKLIVPVEYDQIDITGIYLYAQSNKGTTVYNGNGTQANIDSNIAIINTSNEKYRIRINNENGTKYGVINKEGTQLIEEKYSYIEYLYENYFIVSKENGKLGIVDDKDEVKIEINNDSLQRIQGTDLIQTINNNTKLTTIYSKEMKNICELENGIVNEDENYIKIYNEIDEDKYLSKDGKELKNTDVYKENRLFASKKGYKWGFLDKNGNIVVDYKYDKVTEFNKYGFAAVKLGEKWGAINDNGKEVIAPTYELKNQIEPSFIGKYYKTALAIGEILYND